MQDGKNKLRLVLLMNYSTIINNFSEDVRNENFICRKRPCAEVFCLKATTSHCAETLKLYAILKYHF